ncbi:MAG TPA: poly-gamma-glutamate system protein [Ignavibacteriaceae bacterium]|nr:poly-gamma-glutamate system protein [Ignavibacteriaceae bacterium]
MNNFNAGSIRVLAILSLLALFCLYIVETQKTDVKRKWYKEKLEASKITKHASDLLKEHRLQKSVFIDVVNDPNRTTLIGQDITPITTDQGNIDAKLTSTNPNFAAVVIDMLKEADLKENDAVAVSFTGSFPALNIAVHAAIQTLKLKPVIISSVGASNWGANDPYFTWLDMEKYLYDAGIFKNKSIAASMGGGLDKGRGLSPEGRNLIKASVERTGIEFINEEYLENSIEKRLEIYKAHSSAPFKLFINVGGGIASVGSIENYQFIPSGYSPPLTIKNFPIKGVLIRMSEENIPLIHLLNITQLASKYGLPLSPSPLPAPGEGEIFVQKQYNMTLTIITALILIIFISIVLVLEKRRHRLGTEIVPDGQYGEPDKKQHELTEL